jgi:Domain of unknown function (DUF4276)
MPFRVVPIVEGHRESQAVPILFNRLIAEFDLGVTVSIARPIRQTKHSLIKDGGLERAIELATIAVGDCGAIFVLIDSDGDCPRDLAPKLLARARKSRPDRRIHLVLAHQEYEAWFLASASSLKGCRRLSNDIEDHPTPENVRDCKGWLEESMPRSTKYSETADQAALTAVFNITLARRAPSFDKLYRDVERVCREARAIQEQP